MRLLWRFSVITLGASIATGVHAAPEPNKTDAKKPVAPVGKLSSEDIKTNFFNGQPFTSSTPSGVKFKMTFTSDGKVTREPVGKSGVKGEGTWALDKRGFCTTWKGSKSNCYSLVASGENRWSVMNGPALLGYWSK